MNIPICYPGLPSIADVGPQFDECLQSGQVTNGGKYVTAFEGVLQKYLDSELPPVCFCNGEMALWTLIRAMKIRHKITDGQRVLVPSLTFSGTLAAITLNNLQPVYGDVDNTFTLCIEHDGQLRVPVGCKMIVAVGAYGNLPDIDALLEASEAFKIPLIIDAAPAFGSTYKGEHPGHYAPCIYSFHATKNFSTMEGGCAVTNDKMLRDILVQLRDFGQTNKSTGAVSHAGLNGKMMEICGIVGIEMMRTYGEKVKMIATVAEYYDSFQSPNILMRMRVSNDVKCNYLYYPVVVVNRDKFVGYMAENNIQVRKYYTACHTLEAYRQRVALPFTDAICNDIVALPIHADMSVDEIEYLFQTIKNYQP